MNGALGFSAFWLRGVGCRVAARFADSGFGQVWFGARVQRLQA